MPYTLPSLTAAYTHATPLMHPRPQLSGQACLSMFKGQKVKKKKKKQKNKGVLLWALRVSFSQNNVSKMHNESISLHYLGHLPTKTDNQP